MSASAPKYTLESLAAKTGEMAAKKEEKMEEECREGYGYGYGWNVWIWLIVIFIIVLIILWLFHPNFVLSEDPKCCQLFLDWGKLIIWSIVIALAIVLLIWLFRPYGYYGYDRERKEMMKESC